MAQIELLRQWRNDSIESHLYSTAELVGDKILAMSSHPDDAYWLAQTYYGMGEYLRGAQLIFRHGFESESLKCRYVAGLCLLQAQELEQALLLLKSPAGTTLAGSIGSDTSGSQIIHTPGITPISGSRNPSYNLAQPPLNNAGNKPRVISTSSLKNPDGKGARTVSVSSRVSMILPEFDEDSAHLASEFAQREEGIEELNGVFVEALLQFLVGRIYTLQAKSGLAKEAYIASLRIDARCFDSLSQLVKFHSLTPKEEWSLLASLDFSRIGNDFGRSLYALRLSVLTHVDDLSDAISNLVETFQLPESNGDILAAQGDVAYAKGQFSNARELYESCLEGDAQNLRVYTNYVSSLYELGEKNVLYKTSHELVKSAPDSVEASFAIGVYYLSLRRIPEARRYFSQASLIDPGYAEAWLAFARTFAEEAEHEQAITAFSTVARLFSGYHLPYVHIGIQHLQLMNLGLAEKYLVTAAEFFEEDPLLLNELGVVYYHKKELPRALQVLEVAQVLAKKLESDSNTKLSIKANLGYVLRRMGRFKEALEAFDEVCSNAPLDSNVLAAMGLCLLQINENDLATEKLALALAITRDDPVANDLIKRAVCTTSENFDIAGFASEHSKHLHRDRVEIDLTI